MSLVWKQTASSAARIICFFVVNAVNPQIILEQQIQKLQSNNVA